MIKNKNFKWKWEGTKYLGTMLSEKTLFCSVRFLVGFRDPGSPISKTFKLSDNEFLKKYKHFQNTTSFDKAALQFLRNIKKLHSTQIMTWNSHFLSNEHHFLVVFRIKFQLKYFSNEYISIMFINQWESD